jgi:hypothetical protein
MYWGLRMKWHVVPAEDALMLMRYATNLAGGHGIVWNVGDHPVEGATDFFFLICLSLWMCISHLNAILADRLLLLACHLASVGFLYYSVRKLFQAHWALAASLAFYLALGPGGLHASNGFSATFYGLLASIAWYFACASVVDGPTLKRSILFAVFALLVGLTRPDGVFLAIFMTAAVLYALGRKAAQLVLVTLAVFLVLGGMYFLWRFHYFGYLLPNPFYKKGGGHLYVSSLYYAIHSVVSMFLFISPVYVFGLLAPKARRFAIFGLIPLVGFSLIWILLNNENNLYERFQYVVLQIGLMTVPLIWTKIRGRSSCALSHGCSTSTRQSGDANEPPAFHPASALPARHTAFWLPETYQHQ